MSNNLIEFDSEQKAVIRSQFFPPSATDSDMIYCMSVAKSLGLNPILKEIYFVERKSKVNGSWVIKIEPLAGKNAFMKLAHNSGKFGGLEVETYVKEAPVLEAGEWTTKSDLIAKATVYRTDFNQPFIVEVAYSEYVQRNGRGEVTIFWKDKPQTMLKKVAASQALREAFIVSGLYDESEISDVVTENEKDEKPKVRRRTKAEIEADKKRMEEVKQETKKRQEDSLKPPAEPKPEPEPEIIEVAPEPEIDPHPGGLLNPKPIQVRAFYPLMFANGLKAPRIHEFIDFYNLTPDNISLFCEHEEILKEKIAEFNDIPV